MMNHLTDTGSPSEEKVTPAWWNASPARLMEIAATYEAALEQIAIICTDNMDASCNHRMALDFVRQIANDASSKVSGDRTAADEQKEVR